MRESERELGQMCVTSPANYHYFLPPSFLPPMLASLLPSFLPSSLARPLPALISASETNIDGNSAEEFEAREERKEEDPSEPAGRRDNKSLPLSSSRISVAEITAVSSEAWAKMCDWASVAGRGRLLLSGSVAHASLKTAVYGRMPYL